MRRGIFNTTDPEYTHLNGQEFNIIFEGEGWYDIALSDRWSLVADKSEIELLPEPERLSNQEIIDVIGDLISRVYEPYSGDPSYEEQVESNERAIARAEAAQVELARRKE